MGYSQPMGPEPPSTFELVVCMVYDFFHSVNYFFNVYIRTSNRSFI